MKTWSELYDDAREHGATKREAAEYADYRHLAKGYKMFIVTFKSNYKVKEGRKWVNKTSTWDERIKTEDDAKLRAMALNWQIIKMEKTHD